MVALFKSWLTPLVILSAVPVGLVGVIAILFLTGTAINVQSLLGVIFMVGIVVSNTVLLTDFAQNIRRTDGLSPTAAIIHAASVRVRPVVMTALAAFFALLPMALGLARQRGQHAARTVRYRWSAGRIGHDPFRGAGPVFAGAAG